jgi:hypothetical protein
LLAGRSPPLNQAKNNNQDKMAVAAQGLCPLLPIGIFSAGRKTFGRHFRGTGEARVGADHTLGQ